MFTIPLLDNHKEQSDFCKLKLMEMCEKYYGYKCDINSIGKNEHGKPYFVDNSCIHFNISHSKDKGVIVIDDKPCGVDIEEIRDIKLTIAKRFFTENETKWIFEAEDDNEKKLRFFMVWTGKESYTKMLGCGLTVKLDSFDVLSNEIRKKLEYRQIDNYLLCVCREE